MTLRNACNAAGWLGCAIWLALPILFRDCEPELRARCAAPGCAAVVAWPSGWCERAGRVLCPAHRPR